MKVIPAVPKFYPRHAQLLQRYVLLLAIVFLGMFFSKHRMVPLLILLFPVFYLFARYPPYERINTSNAINEIANSLPEPTAEPANCMSQLLTLLWPHMFNQERVNYFKENLQWVLDHTPVPYFRSIQLKNLTIGDLAPQITQISVPKEKKAPEHSVLLKMKAIYFPSFNLTGILTPAGNMPAFNISFTNLTVMFDTYILFEFKPDPFIENIPYWTAASFLLAKPPQVSGFEIKLFQSSNLINKDSIKAHMSATFSNMIYNSFGVTNAFVWDRITGLWKSERLIGSHGMERVSMSHGEMLRISKIMTQALDYCQKLHIAEPLNIQTKAFKDIETTTYYVELINEFMNNKTIDTLMKLIEEFTADTPSADELNYIFEPTYRFIIEWFRTWSSTIPVPERGKRRNSITTQVGNVDKLLAPLYSYMNFLALQKKLNPVMSEKLQLENNVNALQSMIITFHNKVFKMSS
ncbi:hypothetical protein TRFO_37215 [Tritrichomonas foetus]|uniref:Uncharacterized protein n=1 Tax=Tritrichomonas foetus TaxID=1144522 RepID=A0A1J4JBN4_9EUKA|nr:hypothetical protein TRFO_37215 [Tritrichomonas foetus]|eukprot:OHS96602.1 hypothetical protein TRFO_37215 [Tritrichomonas foetus]